jgi:hypothetical protein
MGLSSAERAEILARYEAGETSTAIAADYGISPHSVRRMASEARRRGRYAPEPEAEAMPATTRRCRNRDCIERFVPVNAQHWFHAPECRDAPNLWDIEDILREEAALSPSSHPLELAKRAFAQKNQLLRRVSTLTSQRDYLRYEVRAFYDDYPEYRWPPVPVPPRERGSAQRVVLAQLSDWQIGKVDNGIGVEVMRARVERIKEAIRSVVERQRQAGYEVPEVVLSWGGDMIEGCYIYGGQNVTGLDRTGNTHRLVVQMRTTAHLMASVAYDVAHYVESVRSEVVGGNHGRPNGRNDFADPEDNFDLLCGWWASDITAAEPRITWRVHENWWGGFEVLGHRFVSLHGDQWRGPLSRLEDLFPRWLATGGIDPKPEVLLTHHRHDFATLRIGGTLIVQNGTIDGGSSWYLKAYGRAAPPTQVIHVVSPRRAVEAIWPVDFDRSSA